jgi:DNA-binding XRE family transcriptional regulator
MWLKAKRIDGLLSSIKMTRAELAQELECSLQHLNRICDGMDEADERLSRLIIAAFGAKAMRKIIDWRRTAA